MNNIKKLSLLAIALFISTFTLTVNGAQIEKTALIKAKKVTHAALITGAQMNLKFSFSSIKLKTVTTKIEADRIIALQKVDTNKNKPITISKTAIIAE